MVWTVPLQQNPCAGFSGTPAGGFCFRARPSGVAEHISKFPAVQAAGRMCRAEAGEDRAAQDFLKITTSTLLVISVLWLSTDNQQTLGETLICTPFNGLYILPEVPITGPLPAKGRAQLVLRPAPALAIVAIGGVARVPSTAASTTVPIGGIVPQAATSSTGVPPPWPSWAAVVAKNATSTPGVPAPATSAVPIASVVSPARCW
jgi:hypothetical protein